MLSWKQIETDRILYMRGFWWQIELDYDEWIVCPALKLNRHPIYGPFGSKEQAMYWLENVFFRPGGEFEKHYPNTGV